MNLEQRYAYRDNLKVEFKDMLEKFLEPRDHFHAYMISRMCTHATMIEFDYGYFVIPGDCKHVGKVLYLKDFGEIRFIIDCDTNYGTIVSEDSDKVIKNFLDNYQTTSNISSYNTKLL